MKKTIPKKSKSMMKLAADLNVSRTTLYSWKEAGAPVEKGEAAILEWCMNENRRGNDTDEMKAAKLSVLKETFRHLKLKNDERSESVVTLAEVQADAAQAMTIFWQALDVAFGNELPPQLVGCTAPDIAERLAVQLDKLKAVIRLEFSRIAGLKISAADYQAVKLSTEAKAALDVCEGRAWNERIHHEWQRFMDWKRKADAESNAGRRAWCRERAAAGLPVPDASDEEISENPGLKRA